jgi:hypothetical protein
MVMANASKDSRTEAQETVVDQEIEQQKPYRPARWQSNLTILSCVSVP